MTKTKTTLVSFSCSTPLNLGGVLLGFLCGGVPPGSPNPDSISDQKVWFLSSVSDLASKKLFHHFIDWNANKIDFLKSISNSHISLSFLLIWNWNDKYFYSLSWFPRKPYPIPGQNGQGLYPFSGQNSAKTIPFGAAHTYVAYVRKYSTGHWIPPSSGWDVVSSKEITTTILTPTHQQQQQQQRHQQWALFAWPDHTSTYSIAIADLFYS